MAKRKEVEEAMEGLSYPQSKIRRLEPKLPDPIEEVPFPAGDIGGASAIETIPHPTASKMAYTMDETIPPSTSTEDRAIVLYNPNPADSFPNLGPVPLNPSILVSPKLLHNLKKQVLHQGSNQNLEDKSRAGNECLAVVPWVPSIAATVAPHWLSSNRVAIEEQMESEENTWMEVDDNEQLEPQLENTSVFGGSAGGEGLCHQWQPQCLAPGAPLSPTSNLMWSQ